MARPSEWVGNWRLGIQAVFTSGHGSCVQLGPMSLCLLENLQGIPEREYWDSMIWIQTVLSPDPFKNAPAQKFWRCGCQMSSIRITGNLLEMQFLRPHPRHTESETPWARLIYLCLNKPSWRLWHGRKLENHWSEGLRTILWPLLALDLLIGKLKIIKLTW